MILIIFCGRMAAILDFRYDICSILIVVIDNRYVASPLLALVELCALLNASSFVNIRYARKSPTATSHSDYSSLSRCHIALEINFLNVITDNQADCSYNVFRRQV